MTWQIHASRREAASFKALGQCIASFPHHRCANASKTCLAMQSVTGIVTRKRAQAAKLLLLRIYLCGLTTVRVQASGYIGGWRPRQLRSRDLLADAPVCLCSLRVPRCGWDHGDCDRALTSTGHSSKVSVDCRTSNSVPKAVFCLGAERERRSRNL